MQHLIRNMTGKALDCGSGIGRVTKHLLLTIFNSVDMVDFTAKFIQQSAVYIGSELDARVGNKFVESLHTFTPEIGAYDLIWIQWVTGQLADEHLVDFLRRCKVYQKSFIIQFNLWKKLEKIIKKILKK